MHQQINVPYPAGSIAPKERAIEILVPLPSTEICNRCIQWIIIKIIQCPKSASRIYDGNECTNKLRRCTDNACLRGYIKLRHEKRRLFPWIQWCTEHIKLITDNNMHLYCQCISNDKYMLKCRIHFRHVFFRLCTLAISDPYCRWSAFCVRYITVFMEKVHVFHVSIWCIPLSKL